MKNEIREHNQSFYEDTYYDLEVRLFIKTYNNINNHLGKDIDKQLLELSMHYPELNPYEQLYYKIINVLDKYCKQFTFLPVIGKTRIGLPVFLKIKEEYEEQEEQKIIMLILNRLSFLECYPFILLDLIPCDDYTSCNDKYYDQNLLKQINMHYNQELFDTDDKYFLEDGKLNLNVISVIDYTQQHTELLHEDYP